MVYYIDNPNLPQEKVVTHAGNYEYLDNCKKYADGYYVKGKELEWTGMNWVKRVAKGFDCELQVEVDNVNGLLHGIVGFDAEGNAQLGYFSANPHKNCLVNVMGVNTNCIDVALLIPELYCERLAEGVYYRIDNMDIRAKKELLKKNLLINNDKFNYNIEDNKETYEAAIANYKISKFPIDPDLKYIGRYLGDVTFGIELETINGTLPKHLLTRYGIVICKDGSLCDKNNKQFYPPEYVSVPLKGAKGLQVIRNVTVEIAKRSDIDIRCSLHVHIGGFKIDRTMLVSLFKLGHKIQADVFKMLPYYKQKPDGVKQQNYCKRLPNILSYYGNKNFNKYVNDSFADLYTFLSGGHPPDQNYNRQKKHNPWGAKKWNMKTRYYWLNFVNPVFGKRDTIEFRIHTPTLNADKIINWLFMCVAIVKYAEAFVKNCVSKQKVTLVDVLQYYRLVYPGAYGTHLSDKLIQYYEDRVAYFAKDLAAGDYISQKELDNDADFKFNITKL